MKTDKEIEEMFQEFFGEDGAVKYNPFEIFSAGVRALEYEYLKKINAIIPKQQEDNG